MKRLFLALCFFSTAVYAQNNKCLPLNSQELGPYTLQMEETAVKAIKNTKTSTHCNVNYAILDASYRMGTSDNIILNTVSGSSAEIIVYDAKKCKEVIRFSIDPSEESQVGEDRISSSAYCDCDTVKKERCECYAAKEYTVATNCQLKLDKVKSNAATKAKLGIEFTGTAKLFHPGLNDVRLIKDAH